MQIYKEYDEAIKSVKDKVIHGVGLRFGSAETKDWDGEFFDANSEVGLQNGTTRPFLMEHGWHRTFGKSVVGIATYEKSDDGWTYEAKFHDTDIGNRAFNEVITQPFRSSAGAAGHTRQATMVKGAWYLNTWLVAEQSATLTPADNENPRVTRVKSSEDYLQMMVFDLQGQISGDLAEKVNPIIEAYQKSAEESRAALASLLTQLKDSFKNEGKTSIDFQVTEEFIQTIEQVTAPIQIVKL